MSFLIRLLAVLGVGAQGLAARVIGRLAVGLALVAALASVGCGRSDFDTTTNVDPGVDSGVPDSTCVGAGCFDSGPDVFPDTPPDAPRLLTKLNVEPASVTLVPGASRALVARGFYSDGSSADVTATAAWTSDNPGVVAVDKPGLIRGVTGGSARVRATVGTLFAEADVLVSKSIVTDLVISPPFADLPVGGTQRFALTAIFSDGTKADVTAAATWSIFAASPPGFAKVDAVGVVTAIAPGSGGVQADFGGRNAAAKLSVTARTVTRIDLSPFAPKMPVGGTVALVATAIFSDGSKSDVTSTATWLSSPSDVATVSPTGLVTGVKAGNAVVSATFSGASGSTPVTVAGTPIVGLTVAPSTATVAPGGAVVLTATAKFADGTTSDVTTSAAWSSSDDKIANVSAGNVKGVSAGSATIVASFAGFTGTATITVSPATLTSITCSPDPATIPLGATLPLTAKGTYSDGSSRDVSKDVAWSTDDATVATIDPTGVVTPVSAGTTAGRARLSGVEGKCTISVVTSALVSITITPDPLSLVAGDKQFAKATGKYSDGTVVDVTSTCTWSTGDAAIATVSNGPGSQGQVTAVGAGKTPLTCALGGVTGSATVVVSGASLTSIDVSPVAPTCHVGDRLQFFATAIDSSGKGSNVTFAATWSSDADTIVQFTGVPGRFLCVAAGTANVSASYGGLTGSTPVTVSAAVLTAVQVDPIDATLAVGDTQRYQAVAIFSDGTSQNVTFMATWTSSDPSVAAISDAGFTKSQATALAPGKTTIQATYKGVTGSTTLIVSSATVVSISIAPASASVAVGTSFRYSAQAIYSDGTSKDVTGTATWLSSDGSVAAVSDAFGTKGQVTTLAAGSTTISATYSGVTGTASLTVTSATITSIQVSPFSVSVAQGTPVFFRAVAIYSDGTSADVTGQATWVSSDASIAAVSDAFGSKGRAQALSAGTATIRASYKGVTGSASMTVTTATLTTIQVTPFNPSVPAGFYIQMRATGIYSDGTTADLTFLVTWTSANPAVADVRDTGFFKGVVTTNSPGTATITASYGGKTGSTDVVVTSATLTGITIGPNPASVGVGADTPLTATGTFSDGSSLDITFYVTWLSSDTSIADVSNASDSKGLAHGFKSGSVTITAQKGAVTGTSSLTVP